MIPKYALIDNYTTEVIVEPNEILSNEDIDYLRNLIEDNSLLAHIGNEYVWVKALSDVCY